MTTEPPDTAPGDSKPVAPAHEPEPAGSTAGGERPLFVDEHGRSMKFTITRGSHRQAARELIERHGGHVSQSGAVTMALVGPEHETSVSGLFRVQYVHDCVEQGRLLPREGYEVLTTGKRSTFRVSFTPEDDKALEDLITANPEAKIQGNKLYKELAKTARSLGFKVVIPNMRVKQQHKATLDAQQDQQQQDQIQHEHQQADSEDFGAETAVAPVDAAQHQDDPQTPSGRKRPADEAILGHSPHHKHTRDMLNSTPVRHGERHGEHGGEHHRPSNLVAGLGDTDERPDAGDPVEQTPSWQHAQALASAPMRADPEAASESPSRSPQHEQHEAAKARFRERFDRLLSDCRRRDLGRRDAARALFMTSGSFEHARQVLEARFELDRLDERVRHAVFSEADDELVQSASARDGLGPLLPDGMPDPPPASAWPGTERERESGDSATHADSEEALAVRETASGAASGTLELWAWVLVGMGCFIVVLAAGIAVCVCTKPQGRRSKRTHESMVASPASTAAVAVAVASGAESGPPAAADLAAAAPATTVVEFTSDWERNCAEMHQRISGSMHAVRAAQCEGVDVAAVAAAHAEYVSVLRPSGDARQGPRSPPHARPLPAETARTLLPLALAALAACVACVAAQDVPSGAVMPPSVPSPAPTSNPFKPNRTSSHPSSQTGAGDQSTAFDTYHFAVTTFLIVLGCVFAFAGLIVGVLVLVRWVRTGSSQTKEDDRRFEEEQQHLAERTATLRRPTVKVMQVA
ncbi:DNA-binding transcription factor rap1 [Polyrhizophydium stewartii]|uniref:DNA-binding protein RAP1 n=1 Tax=Polyrhizophydium stewartii TaxID=2732419 RepID=A0ABR4NA73_9FUNG